MMYNTLPQYDPISCYMKPNSSLCALRFNPAFLPLALAQPNLVSLVVLAVDLLNIDSRPDELRPSSRPQNPVAT